MFNFDYNTKEDIKDHNTNWPQIFDHPFTILIVAVPGSAKTNVLLNATSQVLINCIYMRKIRMKQNTNY